MSNAVVPHGSSGRTRASRFPVYQIDFTAVASGKYIATSKRRIRWRWGFSNKEALDRGETGTACRGEEHDITCVWSVTSGKRLILADGREVHYSNNRSSIFDFSWTMRGNHVLKVIMHAAPAMSATPGFRQYDLLVDGQSFFNMPKVYELGIRGTIPAHSPVPGVISSSDRPAPRATYDLNRGDYVRPTTKEQEDADLQAAIKASLQESKAHLEKKAIMPAPAPSAPAPAPAGLPERGALYRDASEFRLVSQEAKENENDLLDLLGDWSAQPVPAESSTAVVPAPAPAAYAAADPFGYGAAPAPYSAPPDYTQAPAPAAYHDPFAPKPIEDIPPVQKSFNELSLNIMSAYGSSPAPAPTGAPPGPPSNPPPGPPPAEPTSLPPSEPTPDAPPAQPQAQSMNAPFMSTEAPAPPKTAVDMGMSKLVNFDDISAPAESEFKLSMNSNPLAAQEQKTMMVKGKIKSKGLPPTAGFGGPSPSLSEMKSLKPQASPSSGGPKAVMRQPNAMVVSQQQNGNYGGYGAPPAQQGYPPMGQQYGGYQQQPMQGGPMQGGPMGQGGYPPMGQGQYGQQPQQPMMQMGYPPQQQYGQQQPPPPQGYPPQQQYKY